MNNLKILIISVVFELLLENLVNRIISTISISEANQKNYTNPKNSKITKTNQKKYKSFKEYLKKNRNRLGLGLCVLTISTIIFKLYINKSHWFSFKVIFECCGMRCLNLKKKILFITLNKNYTAIDLSEKLSKTINSRYLHSRVIGIQGININPQEENIDINKIGILNMNSKNYLIVFYEIPIAETGTLKSVSEKINNSINDLAMDNNVIIYFLIHRNNETYIRRDEYVDCISGRNIKIEQEIYLCDSEENPFLNHFDNIYMK